jgi:transcriptional regulator with XRE-family HTH domain
MRIELLESIRKKKGLTQAELARMINFSTTGYQKMVNIGDIKVSVLEQIAKIFGVDIMVFFSKETNKSVKGDAGLLLNDGIEGYQKSNPYQKELLACYKTISDLQNKLLGKKTGEKAKGPVKKAKAAKAPVKAKTKPKAKVKAKAKKGRK